MNDLQLRIDRKLARQIARGNVEAFDQFFKEYFPRLYRFILTRTDGDAGLAEEVVQRTMCNVVRKMSSYRGEALLFTWLCQICRNELVSVYRKHGVEQSRSIPFEDIPEIRAALESFTTDQHTPETSRTAEELAKFVRVTLEYLPQKYSAALEMKYIQGYSVDEIGTALNISDKAAESVLSRARASFKEGFRSLWDFEPDFLLK
jgi:RNA polymerase sigma-70 factor (ECF subfamily)